MCTQCFIGAVIDNLTFVANGNNIMSLSADEISTLKLRCSAVQTGYYISPDLLTVN